MFYDIKPKNKEKLKFYEIKKHLSNMFLFLARKLYAENPGVCAFLMKQNIDLIIYGQSLARIDISELVVDKEEDNIDPELKKRAEKVLSHSWPARRKVESELYGEEPLNKMLKTAKKFIALKITTGIPKTQGVTKNE